MSSYTCGKSTAPTSDAAVARVTGDFSKEDSGVLGCLDAAVEVNEELVVRRRAIAFHLKRRIVQAAPFGGILAASDAGFIRPLKNARAA